MMQPAKTCPVIQDWVAKQQYMLDLFRSMLLEADPATEIWFSLGGAIDKTMCLGHLIASWPDLYVANRGTVHVTKLYPEDQSIMRRLPRMFTRPILFEINLGSEQIYWIVVNNES